MLPKEFKPTVKTPLIRLGSQFDGGYVIARESLDDTTLIYGFGVNTDWSFEEDFQRKTKAKVICYDHTVDMKFWRRLLSRELKRMLTLKISPLEFWSRVRLFFHYRNFFNGHNAIHHREMIGPKKMGGVDLHALLKGHRERNVFLKIDIEGWEYRILDQLIQYQDVLTGVVIEFHDVDLHRERIAEFCKNFALPVVHVHGNNHGGVDVNGDPLALEITFKPRSSSDQPFDNTPLPLAGVDNPNNELVPDYQLSFA